MQNQEIPYLLQDLRRRIEGSLTLAGIAAQAGKSRFHFHRDFRKRLGETPRKFIERLRLDQAAARLIGSTDSVCQIALQCGFSSHEVFTRAFRRQFGCAPRRYRATAMPRVPPAVRAKHIALSTQIGPCIHLFHFPLRHSTRKSTMPTISVARQQYAGQHILLIRRKISRPDLEGMLSECFGKLYAHGAKAGLPIAGWPVARYLSVGPGLWTVEAAMPVASAAKAEGEMEPGVLPAGPAAFGIHAGPYEQLPETYAAIEKWMEANGVRPGGAPWESYVTDPAEHPDPSDWRTEVYWPLAE
jgi:AraC-like DNA-binding protein/effector-binding domain-containing protein